MAAVSSEAAGSLSECSALQKKETVNGDGGSYRELVC
jgi:hypothetical protein